MIVGFRSRGGVELTDFCLLCGRFGRKGRTWCLSVPTPVRSLVTFIVLESVMIYTIQMKKRRGNDDAVQQRTYNLLLRIQGGC